MQRAFSICLNTSLKTHIPFSITKKMILSKLKFLVLFLILPQVVTSAEYLSPFSLDVFNNGKKLLISERTGKRVDIFDTDTDKIEKSIKLELEPTGAIVSEDGKTFYVTAGIAPGYLIVIDSDSGKIKKKIPVGHTPISPVLSKDGKKVYVCNRFDNAVSVVDVASLKKVKSIPVKRDAIAADITPDGKLLFVANHMPDGRADVEYVASKMSIIDTEKDEVIKTLKLVNGAEGMRGVCVSPDGKYVYATHLMARFLVPTTQIERGWINTNALSVIRVSDFKLMFTVLLDDVDMGFANPWGVDTSEDGKYLCVASAGNSELSLIDLPVLTKKIDDAVKKMGKKAEAMHLNAHNNLSFISDVRKRIQLKGKGPRALKFVGNDKIYTTEYFSDSLGKVVIKKGETTDAKSIPLGPTIALTKIRKGEIFFNDATLCFQKWQSCASCHSDDGRMDALNWDLLNDGIGNPKNVKSLVFSHVTPPVMALGVRDKAETAVRAGIKFIQFAVRPEEDAEAIDDYLKSLKPLPSPKLVNGKLSEAAVRGKKIFEKSGCITCHPPPLFTDLKSYDVGTGKGRDVGKKFDTPTFIEVWRTSPYMHDGRAVTIYEVIKIHNPQDKRGKTSTLTDDQIKDLAEYIESL